jgi:hypothetical protein
MGMSDPGEEAPALFKTQMAAVFAGTVTNVILGIVVTPALVGKNAGNRIVGWVAPTHSIYVLVYLRGVERAIAWFQDLPYGYFYVLAHGNGAGPGQELDNGRWHYLSVEELGAAISGNRHYRAGKPVVLISCEVGRGVFPRKLSDRLGADVYASPDYVSAGLLTLKDIPAMPHLNWRVWRAKH